jgi:ankyrin repeat protein
MSIALTNAASHGHINIIDYLITNHQADIDRINSRQMTPLLLAVKNGMWSCVEYLLDHHATIEHCDMQKRTCLIIAASEGHLAVIDSLLEKGFCSFLFLLRNT